MRKKYIVGLIVVLVISFLVWRGMRGLDEPRVDGQPISYWYDRHLLYGHDSTRPDEMVSAEAMEVICSMGTNAVAFLVQKALDPNSQPTIGPLLNRVRPILGMRTLPYVDPAKSADARVEASLWILKRIAPSGNVLLPHLTNALAEMETPRMRTALLLLATVGDDDPAAGTHLARALGSQTNLTLAIAAQSLLMISPRTPGALPAILAKLENPTCPINLIHTAGNYGPAASNAVPTLRRHLADPNDNLRISAAVALVQINPADTGAISVIESAAQVLGPRGQNLLLSNLYRVKGHGLALIATLEKLSKSSEHSVASRAIMALEDIDPTAAVSGLREQMKDDQPTNFRVSAAGWILKMEPRDPAAVKFLVEALKSPENKSLHWIIIDQLRSVSADQQVAIRALEYYRDPLNPLAQKAESTLRIIRWRAKAAQRAFRPNPKVP